MMATSPLFDQQVTGRVTAVNEKGVRLDVTDGWCNVSKFATGVMLPLKGETVTLTLDKAGFIRSVDSAATNGAQSARIDAQTRSGPSEKDRTITRLAVLKAAAEFGASRPQLKSAEVLAIAESWERWINREPAEPELDVAF